MVDLGQDAHARDCRAVFVEDQAVDAGVLAELDAGPGCQSLSQVIFRERAAQ